MFDKKLKELEDKRKKIKKEKLEKKKRAERRKRREEKKKLDEKKALEKRKKLQARRQAIEDEKIAKQREIEKAEELARKEKEKKEKLEEKQKRKQQKETEKFLKERQKKHQQYLEIKERMEKEKKALLEKEISKDSEIVDAVKVVEKQQKGEGVKKEKSKINFLGIVFLLLCIAVLAYSSYQIYIWVKSTKDLVTIEEEVINKVVKEVKDTSKDHSIDINFEELTKINSDVVGWIYIENTDVNYPVMQAKDNDYYLKKNIYREYSSCGSIFLDCDTDRFNEDNTVIYGHNLKNQKMFADLKKIYDGEFGKDVYIEIYDKDNKFIKYKIFATYMVEPTLEVVKKDFKISEKKKYIDNAYNQSTVKFNCGFNYQKDLLTLVTCDNTGDKRIIVNALRVN